MNYLQLDNINCIDLRHSPRVRGRWESLEMTFIGPCCISFWKCLRILTSQTNNYSGLSTCGRHYVGPSECVVVVEYWIRLTWTHDTPNLIQPNLLPIFRKILTLRIDVAFAIEFRTEPRGCLASVILLSDVVRWARR